tara:strand:- start:846 stop:1058 length:213 start_codon:yes stop_codon:yes gene_type:complete
MKKKNYKNKILYVKLILKISYEVEISIKEFKKIIDFSLSIINPIKVSYKELKKEILSFLTIKIFTLICKL